MWPVPVIVIIVTGWLRARGGEKIEWLAPEFLKALAYSEGVISSNVSNRGTRSMISFAAPFNPVPRV
jgi:hypothetical protein